MIEITTRKGAIRLSLVFPIMHMFWKHVKHTDDVRLAKQTEPQGIARVYDLPYLDDGDRYHQLDVYYPEENDGKLPVIIDVHGGGWMYGDKELNRMYCLNLAKRGYLVFNMSYRLCPAVTIPEQLQDVMAAMCWIEQHMAEYPCDPGKILLTGDSAGAQLASFTAALLTSETLREVFRVPACGLKLTALGLVSPVVYLNAGGYMGVYTTRMWGADYRQQPTYPFMNLDALLPLAKMPPTFLVASSGDFMAKEQARRAYADFRAQDIPVTLMDFPTFEGEDLPHVFSVIYPESKAGVMAIEGMLKVFTDAMS